MRIKGFTTPTLCVHMLLIHFHSTLEQGLLNPLNASTAATCPSAALLSNVTAQVQAILSSISLDNLGVGRPGHCGGLNWTRVAYLNMTDVNQTCPSNWTQINTPIRACQRKNGGSCDVAYYSVKKQNYIQICGRIVASVSGQPEAFGTGSNNINTYYLDGIDIVRGNPLQLVWSFPTATSRMTNVAYLCPCSNKSLNIPSTVVPPFVGSNYFCDCGAPPYKTDVPGTNYINHTLWSGTDCPPDSTCCTFNTPPWFWRVLNTSVADDIQVRQCSNTVVTDENVNAIIIEVYIKP